jgi:hypothetical protein
LELKEDYATNKPGTQHRSAKLRVPKAKSGTKGGQNKKGGQMTSFF